MERQWGWTNPAPGRVEQLLTQLGLRTSSPERNSLYRALRLFHADPDNEQRLDMKMTDDPALVNEELHHFLREIGESYFGRASREHLTSRAPTYDPEATTEEQTKAFEPLRKALLYCCQRWRQRQNELLQNIGTHTHQTSRTTKESTASQHGYVRHSTRHPSIRDAIIASDRKTATFDRSLTVPASTEDSKLRTYPVKSVKPQAPDVQHGLATETNDPSNTVRRGVKTTGEFGRRVSAVFSGHTPAVRASLPRSDSEKEAVSAVREPPLAPGVNTPGSAGAQIIVFSLHQEAEVKAAAQKRSIRLRAMGNYAQALEARKALAVSRIGTAPSLRKSAIQEAVEQGKQTDEDDLGRNGSKAERSFARLQDFTELQTSETQSTARLGTSSTPASTSAAPEHAKLHRKRAAAEVEGPTTDALLLHEQDEPNPKRMRTDSSPANSEETRHSLDHCGRSPPQAVSQPAQRPTPRTIRVQLCIQNHRGAFVEWPHGMISTHTVQTLFAKFAECNGLRDEPDHINFFLADAKRKREFGIAKGDEEMFEDMKERISIIVKEERHRSNFQVHMEAEVTVESDEGVVLEM